MPADKPFELIYSRQKSGFQPGRAYSNPRFFSGVRTGVTKVFLVGDWPNIEAAYRAAGVPVETLDLTGAVYEGPVAAPVTAPASLTPAVPTDERGRVYIPDDWRDLGWVRPDPTSGLTLRGLGAVFSETPVLNKAQAAAAIEAELARRAGETSFADQADALLAALPDFVEEANALAEEPEPTATSGLTRREINADLQAMGVEIDPDLDIEALADLRDATRAERGSGFA